MNTEKTRKKRITPAYAGNTKISTTVKILHRDHPRLRGEHSFSFFLPQSLLGSPPPTRGTLDVRSYNDYFFRITPAYAGNTKWKAQVKVSLRDHPRLRGEHVFLSSLTLVLIGSPPPTRGTLEKWTCRTFMTGITPAYAGNTCILISLHKLYKDHPRLRGEHSNKIP